VKKHRHLRSLAAYRYTTSVERTAIVRPILRIDAYACQTCSACQARLVCKTRAIVQYERGDLPAIDASRCRGCMVCIPACPFGAVQKTPAAQQSSPPGDAPAR
jgi:Fe-S-cluster-containing hydrogenase component 2